MSLTLPDRPAQYFIDAVLLPEWDPAEAHGYDIQDAQPGDEDFLPTATTIDDVGAVYPSLIISYSNESSGGESTWDFMTRNGPGQTRTGTLIATARAQDRGSGYTGDSSQYSALDADDLVVELVKAVENVCSRRAAGQGSKFRTLGSQRGPDAPDDEDENPPVRIASAQISYSWPRIPE